MYLLEPNYNYNNVIVFLPFSCLALKLMGIALRCEISAVFTYACEFAILNFKVHICLMLRTFPHFLKNFQKFFSQIHNELHSFLL